MSWGMYDYQEGITSKKLESVVVRIGHSCPPFGPNFKPDFEIRHHFEVISPDGTGWPVWVYNADLELARELATDYEMWLRAACRGLCIGCGGDYGMLAPEIEDHHPKMFDPGTNWPMSEERQRERAEYIRTHWPLIRDWGQFLGEVVWIDTKTLEEYLAE